MTIHIQTDYPLSIETSRPVSMTTKGGVTILRIGGTPEGHSGLVDHQTPDPVEDLLPRVRPPRSDKPRCGKIMKRSGQPCARIKDHNGVCMNATQVARKQDYNKKRARERYATDPEYAKHVRAQVAASAKKKEEEG